MMKESNTIDKLNEKILLLETQVKHMTNELRITKEEYETTARNYFDIYSNMGKKVEDQTELLQTVLNNIPAYVYWKDKNQVYMGCNQNQAEAFGIPSTDSIAGKTDYDLFGTKAKAETVIAHDQSVMDNDKPEFHKIELLTLSNEKQMWADCNKVPIHDSDNYVIGVLGVYEDITERIEREKEQKKLEEQVRQAQKLQSLGVLAGGIAHDFNNILTPIIGYSEMAINDLEDSEQLDYYLQRIIKGSFRAKELVKQILTFSRHGAQKKEPLQMDAVLKEALKLIRSTLPVTIEIHLRIQSSSMILGDPTQIHQIFINLCTNASLAISGKGSIEIALENVTLKENDIQGEIAKPGSYLKLTVKDNGEGMSQEVMQRIFEPFFTTKEVGKGTGMGLSVVHGIVKGLDGYITVDSELGKGSTFNIFLPEFKGNELAQIEDKAEPDIIQQGNKEKILLVDDEFLIVEMMTEMLKSLNYNVSPFSRPLEALEAFKRHPSSFSLILTDLTMPRMTGVALAEEILRIRSDIPIIMCSGHGDILSPPTPKTGKISEMITKPVSRSNMAETVKRVLQNSERK